MTKTTTLKTAEISRRWYVVDAASAPLGRLAVRIAQVLMGKHRPTYTPHVDGGDFVVVVNAAKLRLTGRKPQEKVYETYTGYPHGLRRRTLSQVLARDPIRPVRLAVGRMLPKNRLAKRMIRKLKIYPGPEHPHASQNPQPLQF
jgi:large subunit ribosomal protein L13